MEFFEHNVIYLGQCNSHWINCYDRIKYAAANCYQSYETSKKTSVEFVKMVADNKHYAMLGHSNLTLRIHPLMFEFIFMPLLFVPRGLSYVVITKRNDEYLVSGSLRAWKGILDSLCTEGLGGKYGNYVNTLSSVLHALYPEVFSDSKFCFNDGRTPRLLPTAEEPVKHRRYSFEITTNLSIAQQFIRHSPCDYAQESTRFVRYDRQQFNGLQLVPSVAEDYETRNAYITTMEAIENFYCGHKVPNDYRRGVLPKDTKTTLVVTSDLKEFRYIVNLRATHGADKQWEQIVGPIGAILLTLEDS